MRTAFLNFISMILTIAAPSAHAGPALDRLMESEHRPTVAETLSALQQDGMTPDQVFRTVEIDPRVEKIMSELPEVIVAIETTFPGATLAFVGRDSAFLADLIEAYYISKGIRDKKVSRIEISKGSIQSKADALDLLKANGLELDANGRPVRPYVILDATSWRGTTDEAASQARMLVQAVYENVKPEERIFLFDRINAIGLGSSSNSGEKKGGGWVNGKLIDSKLNFLEFFGGLSFGEAGPSKILYVPGSFSYGKLEWHGLFGHLRRIDGKIKSTPGAQSTLEVKESIIASMMRAVGITASSAFSEAVQSARGKYWFNTVEKLSLAQLGIQDYETIVDDQKFRKFLNSRNWNTYDLSVWSAADDYIPLSLKPIFIERWIELHDHFFKNNLFENLPQSSYASIDVKAAIKKTRTQSALGLSTHFLANSMSRDLGLLARGLESLKKTSFGEKTNYEAALVDSIREFYTHEQTHRNVGRLLGIGTAKGIIEARAVPNTFDHYKKIFAATDPRWNDVLKNAVYPAASDAQQALILIENWRMRLRQNLKIPMPSDLKTLVSSRLAKHPEVFRALYDLGEQEFVAREISRISNLEEFPDLLKLLVDYIEMQPYESRFSYFEQRRRVVETIWGELAYRVYSSNLLPAPQLDELNEAFFRRGINFLLVIPRQQMVERPDLVKMSLETMKNQYTATDVETVRGLLAEINQLSEGKYEQAFEDVLSLIRKIYDPKNLKPLSKAEPGDYVEYQGKIYRVLKSKFFYVSLKDQAKAVLGRSDKMKVEYLLTDGIGEIWTLDIRQRSTSFASPLNRTSEPLGLQVRSVVDADAAHRCAGSAQ